MIIAATAAAAITDALLTVTFSLHALHNGDRIWQPGERHPQLAQLDQVRRLHLQGDEIVRGRLSLQVPARAV